MRQVLKLCFIAVLLVMQLPVFSQINSVSYITPSVIGSPPPPINVPTYSRVELGVQLDASINALVASNQLNPYNPDHLNVYAELLDANTMQVEKTVFGFYMLEFNVNGDNQATTLSTTQNNNWRFRFVVEEAKQYQLNIYLSVNNGPSFSYPPLQIDGQTSASNGYVKTKKGHKYFEFTDGSPFFGITENLPEYNAGNARNYTGVTPPLNANNYPSNTVRSLIDIGNDFAAFGGNFLKYTFAPDAIDLEWNTLGDYTDYQYTAHDFDFIFDSWSANDIYLQLCVWNWAQFNTGTGATFEWGNNPYNTPLINTDPDRPATLFYNESACTDNFAGQKPMQNKLRYIIARWGWDPHLISLEFMSELDKIGGPHNDYWGWSGQCNDNYFKMVDNSLITMGNWVKQVCPRMMLTTGVAGYASAEKFFSSEACDYIDFHDYNSLHYNGGCIESYISEFMQKKYPDKPFHSGECGTGDNEHWLGSTAPPSGPEDRQTQFSNIMWSSAFSGSFSNGKFFLTYGYIHNNSGQIAYQKFRPLSDFFDGEDLNLEQYIPVKNKWSSTPTSLVPNCIGADRQPECLLIPNVGYQVQLNVPYYNVQYDVVNNSDADIITSNNDEIEVYALKSERKVLGWVHNKTNYWYNLPHFVNPAGSNVDAFIHPDANGNATNPQTETFVADLQDETMTINGLNCSGIYQIEWWSTRGNGGLIPALTVNNLTPVNGSLTIDLPRMRTISNIHTDLPDYGFKITMTQNNGSLSNGRWRSEYVKEDAPVNIGTSIAITQSNNVFYQGTDGQLHRYYYDEHCWEVEHIPTWGPNDNPANNINSFNTSAIYYRNNINKLEQVYESIQNGQSTWIPYMHSNAPTIDPNSSIQDYDNSIFYVSTNKYITEVYWDGNAWTHIEMSWLPQVASETFTLLEVPGKDVMYRDVNGTMQRVYWGLYQGVMQWIGYSHTSAHSAMINTPILSASNNKTVYISTNGYVTILYYDTNTSAWVSQELSYIPKPSPLHSQLAVASDDKIFYRNINGNLQQIYWGQIQGVWQWIGYTHNITSLTTWNMGIQFNANGVDPYSLYYWGPSLKLHQVYFDNNLNTWIEVQHNNVETTLYTPWRIDQYNKLYYKNNSDGKTKVFWRDNPCVDNPPCTYNNYKPSKPNTVIVSEEEVDITRIQTQNGEDLEGLSNKSALAKSVNIFPNPSKSGVFNIISSNELEVTVTDIQGRTILSKTISIDDRNIDLSNKPSGVYLLTYKSNGQIERTKLVITK